MGVASKVIKYVINRDRNKAKKTANPNTDKRGIAKDTVKPEK